MVVYFIQAGVGGPIKIGIASDATRRLASMQTSNPSQLYLIASMPGDAETEARLHRRFSAGRVRGEWFDRDTPGLLSLVADLLRGDAPPDWVTEAPYEVYVERCDGCGFLVEPESAARGSRRCLLCVGEVAT